MYARVRGKKIAWLFAERGRERVCVGACRGGNRRKGKVVSEYEGRRGMIIDEYFEAGVSNRGEA